MTFLTFLHLLGISLWLGGVAVAVLVNTLEATEAPGARAGIDRVLGKVYAWVVAPGAILAVASGIALTMTIASSGARGRLGDPMIAAMQGVGLLAGLLELFISFPASQRLGQMAEVTQSDSAAATLYRRRVRTVSSIALVLVVFALFLGVIG